MFCLCEEISLWTQWCNFSIVYDFPETWSSPKISGTPPPPCEDHTFTRVDHYRAVQFGGYQRDRGMSRNVYLLDMKSWVRDYKSFSDERRGVNRITLCTMYVHFNMCRGFFSCLLHVCAWFFYFFYYWLINWLWIPDQVIYNVACLAVWNISVSSNHAAQCDFLYWFFVLGTNWNWKVGIGYSATVCCFKSGFKLVWLPPG